MKKIKERDQIIISCIARERNRRVYAALGILVNFFTRYFRDSGEVAEHALEVIAEKYKNQILIGKDGIIQCPAYHILMDIFSQRNPENFSRIVEFQELLKKIYTYKYPSYKCEAPDVYISKMRGMLYNKLEECEEELKRMS